MRPRSWIAAPATQPSTVNGLRSPSTLTLAVNGALTAVFTAQHVVVIVTFGADRALAERILGSAQGQPEVHVSRKRLLTLLGAGALLLAGVRPQVALPPPVTTTGPFTGVTRVGQDSTRARRRSTASMLVWAPTYTIIGVYIGGNSRGCSQPENLTPAWVSTVIGQGWGLLPIWVGPQAPKLGLS